MTNLEKVCEAIHEALQTAGYDNFVSEETVQDVARRILKSLNMPE